MRSKYVQYFVEGEDEEKLVNLLKTQLGMIRPGKVQKLNVVASLITDARLRNLKPGTMAVLVFDTDTEYVEILHKNIEKLHASRMISEIVTIPQVKNLEDELLYCCDIKRIIDLLNSKSKGDFKRDFIRATNLDQKLQEHHFSMQRLWSRNPSPPFDFIDNQSEKIRQ